MAASAPSPTHRSEALGFNMGDRKCRAPLIDRQLQEAWWRTWPIIPAPGGSPCLNLVPLWLRAQNYRKDVASVWQAREFSTHLSNGSVFGKSKVRSLKRKWARVKRALPFASKGRPGTDSVLTSHAEADHLWRLSAEAQGIWACECWALAGYRKWEGVALSLQSLIQGRSEREVVWRRVFYSQHSLPKNKKQTKNPTPQTLLRWPSFSMEKYRLECSF